jgi:hypothetical protein
MASHKGFVSGMTNSDDHFWFFVLKNPFFMNANSGEGSDDSASWQDTEPSASSDGKPAKLGPSAAARSKASGI